MAERKRRERPAKCNIELDFPVTVNELAVVFGVGPATIYAWMDEEPPVPHVRPSTGPRFLFHEVWGWLRLREATRQGYAEQSGSLHPVQLSSFSETERRVTNRDAGDDRP